MTTEPLPETLLVTAEVPVSGQMLETLSSQIRTLTLDLATREMTATAASFGRKIVDGTVCLEREVEDLPMDSTVFHYSALTVEA
jgi:hypothetical protein